MRVYVYLGIKHRETIIQLFGILRVVIIVKTNHLLLPRAYLMYRIFLNL